MKESDAKLSRIKVIKNNYENDNKKILTLSGPAFSVVRQARAGLRGPDAKNQS